jgi:hypothetical protein
MKRDLLADLALELHRAAFPWQPLHILVERYQQCRESFGALLDGLPSESEVHRFLEKNPVLLLHALLDGFWPVASSRSCLFSRVVLGAEFEADFAYCSGHSMGLRWTLVELERPDHPLFNKAGDPSKHLTHATRQALDWLAWLSDHREYAVQRLGRLVRNSSQEWDWPLDQVLPTRCLVVIGRRAMLNEDQNRRRAQMCSEMPGLDIATYDRMLVQPRLGLDGPGFGGMRAAYFEEPPGR